MGWLWVGGLAALAALAALAFWDRRARRGHRLRDAGDMVRNLSEAGDSYLESPERFGRSPAGQ
jgi:hypothetical protein